MRLNFTPTLTLDGLIHMKVQPEVSSLDFTNALTLQGFTVPALSTRRASSEMDLADGQSFAMAGLMDNRVTNNSIKFLALEIFRSWASCSRAGRSRRARMNCSSWSRRTSCSRLRRQIRRRARCFRFRFYLLFPAEQPKSPTK